MKPARGVLNSKLRSCADMLFVIPILVTLLTASLLADEAKQANGRQEVPIPEPIPPAEPTARAIADYEAATKTFDNSIGITLKLLPPGIAWNHCPFPEEYTGKWKWDVRRLTIPEALYVSAHEVTQKQYIEIMGENPSALKGDDLPVTNLRWHDVAKFCRRLSEREKQTYRLPSEIEWEYACRGGTKTDFHFGNTISSKDANFDSRSSVGAQPEEGPGVPVTVGSYKPNGFGLFDMHGNVAEWCLPSSSGGWADPRVVRGGAFDTPGPNVRAGHQFFESEFFGETFTTTRNNVGFRIVRELAPQPGAAFGDSTPKRLQQRIAAVLDPVRTVSRPAILITVITDSSISGGDGIAAMAQGAIASFSVDTPAEQLPRVFPDAASVVGTLAPLSKGLSDPVKLEGIQKILGTEILVQYHIQRKKKTFEVTGKIRGRGFPEQGTVLEPIVTTADRDLLPGIIAIQVMEAIKITASQADKDLIQQPSLPPPIGPGANGFASILHHITDPGGFGGIDNSRIVHEFGPRFIPAWAVYLTHPDFRWRALFDLETMNGPKAGLELVLIQRLILEGRLDEAFNRLMEIGAVYRQSPQWYLRLLECCALYDEEEVVDDVLRRFTKEHPNYAGALSRGEFLKSWAWYARGDGFAGDVNDEDWPKFHGRLVRSANEFKTAVGDFEADEFARSGLIDCATGLGTSLDETMQIFLEGLGHRPDSYSICSAMLNYLRPRWHGNPEILLKFGEACVKGGTWESGVRQLALEAVHESATFPDSIDIRREVLVTEQFQKTLLAIRDAALAPTGEAGKPSAHQLKRDAALAFASRWGILSGNARDAVEGFRKTRHMSFDHQEVSQSTIRFMADVADAVSDSGFLTAAAKVRVALAVGQLDQAEKLIQVVRPADFSERAQLDRLKRALHQARKLEEEGEMTFTATDIRDAWLLSSATWDVDDGWLVGYPEGDDSPIISCPFGFGPAVISSELDVQSAVSIRIDPTARRFGRSNDVAWIRDEGLVSPAGRAPKSFVCRRTHSTLEWQWNFTTPARYECDLSRPAGFAIETDYSDSGPPLRLKNIRIKLARGATADVVSEPFAEQAIALAPPPVRIPAKAALESSRAQLSTLLKPDSKAAMKAADWHLLASKLTSQSKDVVDPAARYVLLTEAIDCEMRAGNYSTAMSLVEKLANSYDVEPWSRKQQILNDYLNATDADGKRNLAIFLLKVSEAMVESEKFDLALEELAVAKTIAKSLKEPGWADRFEQQESEVAKSKKRWESAEIARKTLVKLPQDAEANLALGQYSVFVRRDWTTGLELLARAGTAPLASLAAIDQSTTRKDDGYLKTADSWFEYAKSLTGRDRQIAFSRSVHWFALASLKMSAKVRESHRSKIALANLGAIGLPVELYDSPANGLLRRELTSFSANELALTLGTGFDFSRSWVLSMDFKIKNLNSGQRVLAMVGQHMSAVMWIRQDGARLRAAVRGFQFQELSEIITPPILTRQWTNALLVYDAALAQLQFYVDYQLVDSISCVKQKLGRIMPLRLGGGGDKMQQFEGELRDVWFGNTESGLTAGADPPPDQKPPLVDRTPMLWGLLAALIASFILIKGIQRLRSNKAMS